MWTHKCGECLSCFKVKNKKRKVFKCRKYERAFGINPDWKTSYIACKYFTPDIPENGIVIQMEISDFIGECDE